MVGGESLANELPAASLTVEQLAAELCSRPDFRGVIAWQQGEKASDYRWQSNNCAAGVVFLQLANCILCPPDAPAIEPAPEAVQD